MAPLLPFLTKPPLLLSPFSGNSMEAHDYIRIASSSQGLHAVFTPSSQRSREMTIDNHDTLDLRGCASTVKERAMRSRRPCISDLAAALASCQISEHHHSPFDLSAILAQGKQRA